MRHSEHCAALAAELDLLVATVAHADPAAGVPTCPGWTVADLARHVGGVHRWAAHHVRTRSLVRVPSSEVELHEPADDAGLAGWLADGGTQLLDALGQADGDDAVWMWGADRHVRGWSRRMLHETTIHRVDVQRAAGGAPEVDACVAVDGIDEILANLPHAAYFAPHLDDLRGDGETVCLEPTDRPTGWLVRLWPQGYYWERRRADADA
ncbi:MAG TPA: maleylpyruvate isomerase family mycothiol-dependent enzyme, partial [Acidimicrobiales bacterium]|nr:maleylpyruvate isomerase family mycothiol-dependent enzyme [Acidimicrobiales bacterium]